MILNEDENDSKKVENGQKLHENDIKNVEVFQPLCNFMLVNFRHTCKYRNLNGSTIDSPVLYDRKSFTPSHLPIAILLLVLIAHL